MIGSFLDLKVVFPSLKRGYRNSFDIEIPVLTCFQQLGPDLWVLLLIRTESFYLFNNPSKIFFTK